jgi:hypothetical protein
MIAKLSMPTATNEPVADEPLPEEETTA